MSLVLCASCDRHRRPTDALCPFCGESALLPDPPRTLVDTSKATRAALTFGGLALAASLGGCPAQNAVYGGPPESYTPATPTPPVPAASDASIGPPSPSNNPVGPPAPTSSEIGPKPAPKPPATLMGPAPAYGAPPRK